MRLLAQLAFPTWRRASRKRKGLLPSDDGAAQRCVWGKICSRLAAITFQLLPVFESALAETLLKPEDVDTSSLGWHPYTWQYGMTSRTSTCSASIRTRFLFMVVEPGDLRMDLRPRADRLATFMVVELSGLQLCVKEA